MNFQQLEYVLAVHKHKHFAIAAESCDVTQATLSAMIKKLEEELSLRLFDRSRKPVSTTELGLLFIEKAQNILKIREEINGLNTSTTALEGTLTIGIIPTIANSLLPNILPLVLNENPKLKLNIVEITTEEIKQQLKLDKIDLGILATPINDELFEEHIMYYEPMMVYGVHNQTKEYVSSKDVKNKNIWLLEEGHCFRNQTLTICEIREKELSNSNLNFRGSAFETLLSLSDKFGGYTLLPELYYQSMSEKKQALTKHFQPPIPVREISIIAYRQHAKSKAINYLTHLITETISPLLTSSKLKNSDLDIIGI